MEDTKNIVSLRADDSTADWDTENLVTRAHAYTSDVEEVRALMEDISRNLVTERDLPAVKTAVTVLLAKDNLPAEHRAACHLVLHSLSVEKWEYKAAKVQLKKALEQMDICEKQEGRDEKEVEEFRREREKYEAGFKALEAMMKFVDILGLSGDDAGSKGTDM